MTAARSAAILAALALAAWTDAAEGEAGQWRTAYVKRGFVGNFEDGWLKGPGSVIRSRTPLPFAGTRVKVLVQGCHGAPVDLAAMFLVHGADELGAVSGPRFPVLFAGRPEIAFTSPSETWSDETALPVAAGTWYVQDAYLSAKMPYAYDVDAGGSAPKGSDGDGRFPGVQVGTRVGILRRIDVFTTDRRPGIVCYGDSITHGYGSTPNRGQRYPDQLAALTGLPVLNLGQNGDVLVNSGGAPGLIAGLKGVHMVIFLMGINDLIAGSVQRLTDYTTRAVQVVQGLKGAGLTVCLGTLPPAGGYKDYDRLVPAVEDLRLAINGWIRGGGSGADLVADFDRALADPAAPGRIKTDCQGDHLHPNDRGYAAMAAAAAAALHPAAGR